jgi:site-specific DNA recombinase
MEADREITVLESKINDLRTNSTGIGEVEKTLDSALKILAVIDKVYCESDHCGKRKLIDSIYPEKFTFEELRVRTAKKGDVFEFIYLINSTLNANKKGKNGNFYHLSQRVIPIGFEPMTYRL